MPTLAHLLSSLAEKYDTSKRPLRYFDVRKRGELSASEIRYVKKRFKELVDREACVERDSSDPSCYEKVSTDLKPKKKKRGLHTSEITSVFTIRAVKQRMHQSGTLPRPGSKV